MNGHRLKADLSIITSIRLYLSFRSERWDETEVETEVELYQGNQGTEGMEIVGS